MIKNYYHYQHSNQINLVNTIFFLMHRYFLNFFKQIYKVKVVSLNILKVSKDHYVVFIINYLNLLFKSNIISIIAVD